MRGHGRRVVLPATEGVLAREQERTPEHAGAHGLVGPDERVARALHQSCSPPSVWRSVGAETLQVTRPEPQVRLALQEVRIRSRTERRELAGLELSLDLLVDLVLGRVGIGAAQLPAAEP